MSSRELRAAQKAAQKAALQRQLEQRQSYVDHLNSEIERQLNDLNLLLEKALQNRINFEQIIEITISSIVIPDHPGTAPTPPRKESFEARIPQPGLLEKIIGAGKSKRMKVVEEIQKDYKLALGAYNIEKNRYDALITSRNNTVALKEKARNELKDAVNRGLSEGLVRYFSAALKTSSYPDTFPPSNPQISINSTTGELILEYELPTYEAIMPKLKGYKYIKSRDEIQEQKLTQTDGRKMKALYEDVIAAIALRSIHEIFSSDQHQLIKLIVFNGMVNTTDRATGRKIRPCLVSVQVSKGEYEHLELSRVDKKACLKHLKAQTSPSSTELVPVKPIVELVTTDSRFVEEIDVLSDIDSRTNLLEMSPADFEHLISNLFSQIGYKTGTTQISRDGGVDVIAFDERPIVGGKIVIQAKRYRNTVGVESVRALYGVMQDEGATKGVLVTTSSFGAASRDFAKNKPVELIDGNHLLYLLEEHAGLKAKIQIPPA